MKPLTFDSVVADIKLASVSLLLVALSIGMAVAVITYGPNNGVSFRQSSFPSRGGYMPEPLSRTKDPR